jgi:hypothetical protein
VVPHTLHHRDQGFHIGGVSRPHLATDGAPAIIKHRTHHHPRQVGPMVLKKAQIFGMHRLPDGASRVNKLMTDRTPHSIFSDAGRGDILRRLLPLIIVIMAALSSLSPAYAETSVQVTPLLLFQNEYNNNFNLNDENRAKVWAITVAPGLKLTALGARTALSFSYSLPYTTYIDIGDSLESSNNSYLGHDLSLSLARRIFTRMTVGFNESFILTEQPTYTDVFTTRIDRSKYWRNRIEPYLSYELGPKGEIRVGYRQETLDYLDSWMSEEDSIENRGIVTLTYNLNSRNHIDLENQVWARNYDGENSSYDAYQGKVIFRHDFNNYLRGRTGLGYQLRNFNNPGFGEDGSFAFDAGLVGSTDRTKTTFLLQYGLSDFAQDEGYFRAFRSDLSFEWIVRSVYRPYVGGFYQSSDYLNRDRQDNTVNLYVGLGYLISNRYEISIEYNRLNNYSSDPYFDYGDNRFFIRFTAKGDFNLAERVFKKAKD